MPQDPDTRSDGRQALERGRTAVEQRAWDSAYAALAAADDAGFLIEPEDTERFALCAQLTGRSELAEAAWARAHEGFLDRGDVRPAVRCAFWLGLVLIVGRGIEARGGAWVGRARRLLDEHGPRDCPEWGYLLLPEALRALDGDEPDLAYVAFGEAVSIGERWDDDDLMTLGRLGQGQASLRLGEPARGVALLDEAMLTVETGRVSALASGIVYCAVLLACQQLFDLRRAREWTETFTEWCHAQPGLVPFRGQCLVHRSQVAQLRGDWREATEEADRACRWLSDPPDPALGMAYYQRAELHRIHGEYAAAESAYRAAADRGHDPHPGLALVWLAQGRTDPAVAAMRRALDETSSALPEVRDELSRPRSRAEALAAAVDILLSAGEGEVAEEACAELGRVADTLGTDVATAMASRARGQVLLAQGRPRDALEPLVSARRRWLELRAPHETARTRVLVGRALRSLGDEETAAIEFAAAERAFTEAGVEPDPGDDSGTSAGPTAGSADGLTAREVEVLRLVSTGSTNREIAARLVISDKTVARHLHNILTKLDLPNRSAATAFAYERGIV